MKKPTAKSVEEVNVYLEGLALRLPETSTDNSVPRFDGTGGTLQDSGVTISDDGGIYTTGITSSVGSKFGAASGYSMNLYIDAGGNLQNAALMFTKDNTKRWFVGKEATSETGSNAGSNFRIWRYNDDGSSIGQAFGINRATGKVTIDSAGTTAGLELGSSGPREMVGTGSPEGAVTAPAGSVWRQTDHATFGYLRWIKNSGTGSTGWIISPEGRIWCQGTRTTNQSISDATSTVITYTTETDRWNMLNTGTGKITIPLAGLWEFSAQISWDTDFANWQHASISNETAGATVASLRTASGPHQVSLSGMLSCAANDVISVGVFQDSVGAQNIAYARFTANLVGT